MKPQVRTSKSHPLQIAAIELPGRSGVLGLTLCPGKKDTSSRPLPWDRDLATDIRAIKVWGAAAVVCLMEGFELPMLQVGRLPAAVRRAGMEWLHLPIVDVQVPDAAFEAAWTSEGPRLHEMLSAGKRVLVHCRGGLGRSGMIAARLLVEAGLPSMEAVALVRDRRPGAIETSEQEAYVRRLDRRPRRKSSSVRSEDRAIGCLVGLAVGDALGTTLEFSARDSRPQVTDMVGGGPFRLKAGEWTDDTSMALCLADSLLACRRLAPDDLMKRFRAWREEGHNSVNGRCFDIGITTSQAISRSVADGNPLAGSIREDAAGNGSIMRLAPVPIFFRTDEPLAKEKAVLQSQTTHGASECLDACRLMTGVLVRLIGGSSWKEALHDSSDGIGQPKIGALAGGKSKRKRRDQIKSTGYVVDTLEAALWAVERTNNFSEAVLLSVNLGGDADTVGAVTGQLAGARYGFSSIPTEWVTRLAWSNRIISLAKSLHRGA